MMRRDLTLLALVALAGLLFQSKALGQNPTGACCSPTRSCTVTTPALCTSRGGTYHPETSTCNPNPCPVPVTGACCSPFGGSCSVTTRDFCTSQGFNYQTDGSICTPPLCPTPGTGACCVIATDPSGTRQNC